MSTKKLPLDDAAMLTLARTYPTPFHLYDERAIREHARAFKKAFSWVPGFKNYYAVKACPNPAILRIMKEEGFGADCSSLPELVLAKDAGMDGEELMFTSNDTPDEEFKAAFDMGAVINLDDITHIDALTRSAGFPDLISFRYNPGPDRTGTRSSAILSRRSTESPPPSWSIATGARGISEPPVSPCIPWSRRTSWTDHTSWRPPACSLPRRCACTVRQASNLSS